MKDKSVSPPPVPPLRSNLILPHSDHALIVVLCCVGVAAGSGMAATTMLCQMLKSGDHIVAMDDLYGGEW